jgi:polyhydroxyalkanoate synthase
LAYLDWASHLAISPGKRIALAQSLFNKLNALGEYGLSSLLQRKATGPASKLERRVSSDAWSGWPYNVMAQAHQTARDWWNEATRGIDGVRKEHEIVVNAVAGQILDLANPANFLLTNPDVLERTREERGKNLWRGMKLLARDHLGEAWNRGIEENTGFKVGENIGVTPGKVIFQNHLIELIQYDAQTDSVGAEPVLICPPWIMKYYILDLSPENSLVRYLVEQGKTVFMISWKNPTEKDRDINFDDYREHGVMPALDAVSAVQPRRKIHTVGYCIGGTLLSIAAATMAREGDNRLESVSLFAAQADFSEAGDIKRFISPSQLSFLDKLMWKQGYLGIENMGGAFSSLRASELIHAAAVDRYLMGKESQPNDLMAWNADGTRMPYRMHRQYLEKLYLNNELARNKFEVGGRPISLGDLRVPLFVLGTETDHVAPWNSGYKFHDLTGVELTYCLTSGGHNAGVISGPSHPRRRHRIDTRQPGDRYVDPDTWLARNKPVKGSWWPAWNAWLDARSSEQVAPPKTGAARKGYKVLRDAPGEYVLG